MDKEAKAAFEKKFGTKPDDTQQALAWFACWTGYQAGRESRDGEVRKLQAELSQVKKANQILSDENCNLLGKLTEAASNYWKKCEELAEAFRMVDIALNGKCAEKWHDNELKMFKWLEKRETVNKKGL